MKPTSTARLFTSGSRNITPRDIALAALAAMAAATCGGAAHVDRESAARSDELPRNPWLADSPSAMGHFEPGRQASTFHSGPTRSDPRIQVRDFRTTAGADIGTSPWHVLSAERYGRPGVRTIWGASLKYAYKYVVDGERFEFAGLFELNQRVTSIPWNLVALADGRIVVPDTDGFDLVPVGHPCRTRAPTLLALRDGADPASPIACVGALELTDATLRASCRTGPASVIAPGSGANLAVTFTGELVSTVRIREGGAEATYAVAISHGLDDVLTCTKVDDTQVSNQIAAEPIDADTTALYVATDAAMVKLTYRARTRALERVWTRGLALRRRTGTTPTLVNAPTGERLVVVVDAPCAVVNVLTGIIVCDGDGAPAKLIGVRREDDVPAAAAIVTADLPAFIRTVENSPAARRDVIVVANYSGYTPDGLLVPPGGRPPGPLGGSPDAVPTFSPGLVAVRYVPRRGTFDRLWSDAETQVSGVPTISAGANLVYGTGAEQGTRKTYLYGFRLEADERGPAGERVMRVELGAAPFRTPRRDAAGNQTVSLGDFTFQPGELFDSGNNLVINSDRSLFMSAGSALVRIRD